MKLINRMISHFDNTPHEKAIVFSPTMEPRPITEQGNTHQYYYHGDFMVSCKRGIFRNELDVYVNSQEAGWCRVRPLVRADWLENLPSVYLDWLEDMSSDKPLLVINPTLISQVVKANMMNSFFYELDEKEVDAIALNLNKQMIQCNQMTNNQIIGQLIRICERKKKYVYNRSMIDIVFYGVDNTDVVERFKSKLFSLSFKHGDASEYMWHNAKRLPNKLCISAYENKHEGVTFQRYNELCLIKADGSIEFISLRNVILNLGLDNVEYISVPIDIPSDIERVINVIYGTHIEDNQTVGVKWELYKR